MRLGGHVHDDVCRRVMHLLKTHFGAGDGILGGGDKLGVALAEVVHFLLPVVLASRMSVSTLLVNELVHDMRKMANPFLDLVLIRYFT